MQMLYWNVEFLSVKKVKRNLANIDDFILALFTRCLVIYLAHNTEIPKEVYGLNDDDTAPAAAVASVTDDDVAKMC